MGRLLFALEATKEYGKRIAEVLQTELAPHEERLFEDGEHKARPLVNVRKKDVFVIHSLYGAGDADGARSGEASVNDKLCRLLFFIATLKDASAASVTAIVPYLCYSRKDRKTQPRDPVTTRYVATLFNAVGIDRMVTMDVHNLMAYQNAFRCPTEHLEATKLFVAHFASCLDEAEIVVLSPDPGGVKRAERFQLALSRRIGRPVSTGFVEKYREAGIVRGEALIGEVRDRNVVIYDDLIGTGETLVRAARAARLRGARRVYAAATHGLFIGGAPTLLAEESIDRLVVTDTVPPFRLSGEMLESRVTVLESASLVAEAIRCIHEGDSLIALLES